ncbi:hypothetical protein HH310_07875 [Actinoplanes sp. TBRC 11911]|uniref:hypothetical protein n=1 Tax=Actinoplanes sp. TBRC 11911 TaxID=2729386 RepID=UPI00145D9CCF|nr:hypothetical protein [Actinoplanes sp. TBRC 11911]NMO51104.1 hypothetical protein [Actinoplanes sp. TBRC 11911]
MAVETLPLTRTRDWHRPLLVLTGAAIVLSVVAGIGVFTDPQIVTGVPAWLKPFKFAVSFAIYMFTMAWLLAVLPRRSRNAERAGTVIVAIVVIELAVIVIQAARGTMSHFNDTTPFNGLLFRIMGVSVMVLFFAHIVIGVVALRQRIGDRPTTYAVQWGLGLALLGMLVAVPMLTPLQDPGIAGLTGSHSVGVPDGGPGMPVTGWSTTGGDLRIGHFVGLHGMQALPILAFLLARYGRRLGEATRGRLVVLAGASYAVLVVLLTWQAFRAQPLLRPDMLTLAAVATLAAGSAIGLVAVLGRRKFA